MNEAQIIHKRCDQRGPVLDIAFSCDHEFMAVVTGEERTLTVSRPHFSQDPGKSRAHDVYRIGFRTFLALGNNESHKHEVLYTTSEPGVCTAVELDSHVYGRRSMSTGYGEPISCIQSSHDGRYLALGDTAGNLVILNFDLPDSGNGASPTNVFSGSVTDSQIWSIAFDRSNARVFVTTENGGMHLVEVLKGCVWDLDNDSGWPCMAIDCHASDGGIAFAGNGKRVWLIESNYRHKQPELDQLPFALQVHAEHEEETLYILPNFKSGARIMFVDTGVGRWVNSVKFWDKHNLIVVGENGMEIWNLENNQCWYRCLRGEAKDHLQNPLQVRHVNAHKEEVFICFEKEE
jgi:WD40 repeat protein